MIACQLTAQSALRLELLLPVKETKFCVRDSLNTMEVISLLYFVNVWQHFYYLLIEKHKLIGLYKFMTLS